jgi:catechol 2,3-dioxygenase-like lactoylglutathione lyase family enzyme
VSDPAIAVPALRWHHVRLPVSDVMRSRDWYTEVFGFEPLLDLEEEDRVVGVVVGQWSGPTLGLHYAPTVAHQLDGFCPVALSVGALDDLDRWCTRLDMLGVSHSAPTQGHLGWYIEVPDPDGIIVELHTNEQPSADEA